MSEIIHNSTQPNDGFEISEDKMLENMLEHLEVCFWQDFCDNLLNLDCI